MKPMTYSWNWKLADIKQDKEVTVLSCFSCGGGSTMGYKRAGFKVLGNIEIDPAINTVYKANHHPKYNYCMDLREFNKKDDLPDELYALDILDGSPPCSTFSVAGDREKAWGKKKKFREGQKEQTLDDLFFVFLDTVEKLRPKVVIAENVTGMLKGNAKGYINMIVNRFHSLGYAVQLFKLNAAYMDVPQARERIFFIANRMGYPKLRLEFHGKPITFGEVRTADGVEYKGKLKKDLDRATAGDIKISDIRTRCGDKYGSFNNIIVSDDRVTPTLPATAQFFRYHDRKGFSTGDIVNCSSFPQDYDFMDQKPQYICGMSVPPNMMANIATAIYDQWFKKEGKHDAHD